jgi:hypothetical protein
MELVEDRVQFQALVLTILNLWILQSQRQLVNYVLIRVHKAWLQSVSRKRQALRHAFWDKRLHCLRGLLFAICANDIKSLR